MTATGKPVVVTRAEGEDGPLSAELRALGLDVLLWPAVSVAPSDPQPLRRALEGLGEYAWIVFASRHAVAAVLELLAAPPTGVQVAAIGEATAMSLRQRGWPVHLVPEDANAAALIASFAQRSAAGDLEARLTGRKVLYPASSRALPVIAEGLRQLGAEVVQVEAYRTEPAGLDVRDCRNWIEQGGVGAVTFASPSAVTELERALGRDDFRRLLDRAAAVAIGPTTARELRERGWEPATAREATLRDLAQTTFRILEARH